MNLDLGIYREGVTIQKDWVDVDMLVSSSDCYLDLPLILSVFDKPNQSTNTEAVMLSTQHVLYF